ncbi:MAG TPA: hypothetical protein ENO22_01035 [candidate division Zixibacteria bacterium]|nr:hypothetical protein [candidate division Zixibacteria bacterium]
MSFILLAAFGQAYGHCDSEDGPIIPLIRESLDNGDVTPLLKWIAPEDEAEIKNLFARVRTVRSESDETRAIADRLFIETFIRLHRASEGAPYTGIKEAGNIEPIYIKLDKALETGNVGALADEIAGSVRENIVRRYERAVELSQHKDQSVEAGREYVKAYVDYMHFVEGLHGYLSGRGHDGHSSAEQVHGH